MAGSIWPKASPLRVARALKAHSFLALAIGALIYILAVTGSLLVFNHEFQRWEQPAAPEMASISPQAAQKAAETVFRGEEPLTSHLYIGFPTADLPRTVITTDTQAFLATPAGEIAAPEHHPWTQFVLDLHYYLHLPQILGLTVVGALGAALLGLTLSGFLSHPRVFKDAFTFRRGDGRVPLADLHNRLSVWTAPFHLSNALTGSILGLASILAFAIAAASFGGDTTKVFAPIFGSEMPAQAPVSELAEIAAPLTYMSQTYPDNPVTFYVVHEPGTGGQYSSVIAGHGDRLIFGEYYNFDALGGFQGTTGIADGTAGQQIAGSIYNIHFGNWGGLPVKLAYLVFGLALSMIMASGLRIYFTRRREKGRAAPRLEAVWDAVVWGTPALLAATLVISLLGAPETALAPVFWWGLVALCAAAGIGGRAWTGIALKAATGAALLAVTAIYVAAYGAAAFSPAGGPVTLVIALVAAGLLVSAREVFLPARPVLDQVTPAE
ncbi:MAG: PepSY-associated TM helix domain-containing protein [Pseudomonadota bacterium]